MLLLLLPGWLSKPCDGSSLINIVMLAGGTGKMEEELLRRRAWWSVEVEFDALGVRCSAVRMSSESSCEGWPYELRLEEGAL
jgi:hypothetical protein